MSHALLALSLLFTFADDKANTEALKAKGFKIVGAVIAATEEAEVDKALRNLSNVYNTVKEARQRLTAVERDVEANKEMIRQLTIRRNQLGQLMEAQNTVARRNAVVAQYNAVSDELRQRMENDQKGDILAKAKEVYATPRNAYLKSVIALRDLIDKTDSRYKAAASDTELAAALAAINKADNRKLILGPSKEYQANVKTFAKYEALIMSDSIPLERSSNTYMVDVILNGKDPVKMVFDTGASMISISHKTAIKLGLKPSEATLEGRVTIANGETVKVKRMKLASVRVGKFEAKNVDCVVMPEDLPDSPPLLGGSFLNQFKYEIDADAGKLRLSRVDAGNNTKTGGK
ncbi:MAG TPA: TIGR02281 family clan AA aspartic protease [Gemmatales bacterium]|nr:TIGR02281 family clan AA aspartic protease [Gemmatales bacterium]